MRGTLSLERPRFLCRVNASGPGWPRPSQLHVWCVGSTWGNGGCRPGGWHPPFGFWRGVLVCCGRCHEPRIVVPRCGDPTLVWQCIISAKPEKHQSAEQVAAKSPRRGAASCRRHASGMTMRGGLRPCSAQGASIGCSQKANHAPPPHHFKPPSAKGEGLFQRPSHPGSEPVQQAFEIVEFHVGPVALARASPDLVEQIARPAIDILALQQVVLRPRAPPLPGLATQGIGLRLSRRAVLLALPARVLLFRHRLAHVAHALAQRLHGVGLIVDGPGQIVVAQRLFGALHRAFGPFQRLARGLSGFAAQTRQALPLALQFAAQRLLPVGQFTFGSLPALTVFGALLTFAALALLLAALAALARLPVMALAPALAAALALVALRLAGLRAGIELFLQVAERLIRQTLLFAQRLGQTFHRLLPRRLALLAL